ncbi:type VI secretion protein VgrG [Aggregatibacter actinomycetemcomitans]|uniref:Type VI secretion protein VgrG n=1 Tax=Aggregatibacter actinomycetemcomitans TaxID=714 RepID=A0A142G279_AGGAC|nr:hypothetical protein [Aggregatibacter actinomycetemcomitans]AFI86422.1 type VI secretion protein VgrG [Aggregatibacter actinomycetemcomitans D7S-1]AMQ94759.1 type VI secretion protein VgrG [Aggregatibacter actinomycetemcomitans]ANU82740.1 type VI secretion protein VgrG [Aggregatibacter actinomycetemcomitans]EKX93059.1 hypothetical protein HMPREF9996_02307 [Aggregatibacter actinomycetemcomitans Y4]KND84888.1 type VI secretion protein VgrG [Aggregatibacter actinomycetemcomitans serotype a str
MIVQEETVAQDGNLTVNRDQTRNIGSNRVTKIEKDDVLNMGNNHQINLHTGTIVNVGNDEVV